MPITHLQGLIIIASLFKLYSEAPEVSPRLIAPEILRVSNWRIPIYYCASVNIRPRIMSPAGHDLFDQGLGFL